MMHQPVFDAFALGYGMGLRVKMNKKTKTNIYINYGRERNGSGGIYFNLRKLFKIGKVPEKISKPLFYKGTCYCLILLSLISQKQN